MKNISAVNSSCTNTVTQPAHMKEVWLFNSPGHYCSYLRSWHRRRHNTPQTGQHKQVAATARVTHNRSLTSVYSEPWQESSSQQSSFIGGLIEGSLYNQAAMQSPVYKEENTAELSWNRLFKYLRESLKYNSLERGRSMRTLATSLLLCFKCRPFCKSCQAESIYTYHINKSNSCSKIVDVFTGFLAICNICNATQCQSRKNLVFSAHIDTVCWNIHGRLIFQSILLLA